jgi:hypothetical protein
MKELLVLWLSLGGAEAQSMRQRYLDLAQATLRQPITHDELRAALLSSAGVEAIRSLFERSVLESLVLDGNVVTPELGGEATLDDGRLVLVPYPDPVHPILREMVGLRAEPERLLSFLQSTPDGRTILDGTGGLHALLYQLSRQPPSEQQLALLDRVVSRAVATHFKTWSADPPIQARMIETTDWRGRYVGFWHIHPPRLREDRFTVGIEPSVEDMTNAIELGQFLTLVFQPDGFDAYDLAPLARARATDLSRARVVTYRSPDWKSRFAEVVRSRATGR